MTRLINGPLQIQGLAFILGCSPGLLADLYDLRVAQDRRITDQLTTNDFAGAGNAVVIGGCFAAHQCFSQASHCINN